MIVVNVKWIPYKLISSLGRSKFGVSLHLLLSVEPFMHQGLLCAGSLFGVRGQEAADEILGFFGHVLPVERRAFQCRLLGCIWELELASSDALVDSHFIFAIKREVTAREELVSYYSERPDVAFFIVGSFDDLRRYIVRRTTQAWEHTRVFNRWLKWLAQAKIDDSDL